MNLAPISYDIGLNPVSKNDIEAYKKKATSEEDVYKLAGGNVKVMLYPEILKYNTLEELLAPYGAVIILYMTEDNYGHWVGIFGDHNYIEFFDPYGYFPDDERSFVPAYAKKKFGEDFPHLVKLLYDEFSSQREQYDLNYNNYKLQSMKNNTATCGRHTGIRLLYRDLTIDQYKQFLDNLKKIFKFKDYDDLITFISLQIL